MVALLLKAANCEQLFNNKSLVFNNFIHNSEQSEVLLTEPVVLHPQLLQGLKRKACIIFVRGWRLGHQQAQCGR